MRHTIIIIAIFFPLWFFTGCEVRDYRLIVKDTDGKPVSGVKVVIAHKDGYTFSGGWVTDEKGLAECDSLLDGDKLWISELGFKGLVVPIVSGKYVYEVELVPCTSAIEFTIVDSETGRPVPDATIRRYNDSDLFGSRADEQYWFRYWRSRDTAIVGYTDEKGRLAEELFPCTYQYYIVKDSYDPIEDCWEVVEGEVTRVNLRLVRRSVTITGKVYDAKTGKQIFNPKVYAVAPDLKHGGWNRKYVAKDEEFAAYGLSVVPDEYIIGADAPGYHRAILHSATYEPWEDVEVSIGLVPNDVHFTGTVTDRETGAPIGGKPPTFRISSYANIPHRDLWEYAGESYNVSVLPDGTFQRYVAPDNIDVTVRCEGYVSYRLTKIMLRDVGKVELNIALEPIPPLTAQIRCTVRDKKTGKPLEGADTNLCYYGTIPGQEGQLGFVSKHIANRNGVFAADAPPGKLLLITDWSADGTNYYRCKEVVSLVEGDCLAVDLEVVTIDKE